MGALGAGFVILGEVWELWELRVGGRGRDAKLWSFRSWKHGSGQGLGAVGAGVIVLGKVWELWELNVSCLVVDQSVII